jgi:hypothetical protein
VWWAGSARATRLWIGRSFAAISGESPPGSVGESGFSDVTRAMTWLHEAVRARKEAKRWTVNLGSGLARPYVFKRPQGLKSTQELHAVAEAIAAEEAGWSEAVRVWVSAPDVAGQCLGVAVVGSALAQIEAVAQEVGAQLVSVRPGWALLTDNASASTQTSSTAARLLLASDPDGLVALADDGLRWLWGGAIDRLAADADGGAWRTRLAMRLQIQAPPVEFFLDGLTWVPARESSPT